MEKKIKIPNLPILLNKIDKELNNILSSYLSNLPPDTDDKIGRDLRKRFRILISHIAKHFGNNVENMTQEETSIYREKVKEKIDEKLKERCDLLEQKVNVLAKQINNYRKQHAKGMKKTLENQKQHLQQVKQMHEEKIKNATTQETELELSIQEKDIPTADQFSKVIGEAKQLIDVIPKTIEALEEVQEARRIQEGKSVDRVVDSVSRKRKIAPDVNIEPTPKKQKNVLSSLEDYN